MSVVLTDKEYETVMKSLIDARHDLAFFHGLHVTDIIDDVNISWDIDCINTVELIDVAISDLDALHKGGETRD